MSANEFIDTNMLVYAHDRSSVAKTKRGVARQLLARLWEFQTGCISIQVLQEFYVIATQKIALPLASEEAYQVVEDYLTWTVHSPTGVDVLAAIQLQQTHKVSYWDALIVQSALRLDCGVIWSEDLNSGQSFVGTTVLNPFAEKEDGTHFHESADL